MTREEAIQKIRCVEQELFTVAPLPLDENNFPTGFDIQIRSIGRSTKWLRITPGQMKEIEKVLLDVKPTILD